MKKYILVLLILNSLLSFSQVLNLPPQLSENSGLIFYNDKIITHNDSDSKSELYELDVNSGKILRTITISNAINKDWEDIAQDNKYIYISDTGNNKGVRTDLRIYKISKADFLVNNYVNAEIINYKYSNQKSFIPSLKNNFDAESLISYNDSLLIFSKNRGDNKTNIYKLPKSKGTYKAELINTIDVNGQITGATYNKSSNTVVLCGYSSSLTPFLVILNNFNPTDKSYVKIDLSSYVGAISQVEGVTFTDTDKILVSRENFKKKIAGFFININASIFTLDKKKILNQIEKVEHNFNDFISNSFVNTNFNILEVNTQLGKNILNDLIKPKDIKNLPKGNYYIKIKKDELIVNKKYSN